MLRRAGSAISVLAFVGIGMSFSVVALVLCGVLPTESRIRHFLGLMNWPWAKPLDWYIRTFGGGNTDQFIPQSVVLGVMYWLTLGASLGLASHGIWRYLRGNKRGRNY